MGCVILELLIWAVLDFESVECFASERYGRKFPGKQINVIEDDAFWQRDEDGKVRLRDAVTKQIDELGATLRDTNQPRLKEVLGLVKRALETDKGKRINADSFKNTMDSIYRQAVVDSRSGPQVDARQPYSQTIGLSTNPADRRTRESRNPPGVHRPGTPPQQQGLYIGSEPLTASPVEASPRDRRKEGSFNHGVALSERLRTHSHSDPSLQVREGSSESAQR